MARQRILRDINQAFADLYERFRRLELRTGHTGNWSFVEDQATGNLCAVRFNGTGVDKTVRIIAYRVTPEEAAALAEDA